MSKVDKSLQLINGFNGLLLEIQDYYNLKTLKESNNSSTFIRFKFNKKEYSIYLGALRGFYEKLLSDFDVEIQGVSFLEFADNPSEAHYELAFSEIEAMDEEVLDIEELELRDVLIENEKILCDIEEVYYGYRSAEDYEFGNKHENEMTRVFTGDGELSSMLEMYENEYIDQKIKENRFNTGEEGDSED